MSNNQTLTKEDIQRLELPWYKKIYYNGKCRLALKALTCFVLSMLTIYLNTSDNSRIDTKYHTKTRVSGSIDKRGGLIINGISVPYTPKSSPILHLEDYVNKETNSTSKSTSSQSSIPNNTFGQSNTYNIRFTKNQEEYSVSNIIFTFGSGNKTMIQEFSYPNDLLSEETKELNFSNLPLTRIDVQYTNGTLDTIVFK